MQANKTPQNTLCTVFHNLFFLWADSVFFVFLLANVKSVTATVYYCISIAVWIILIVVVINFHVHFMLEASSLVLDITLSSRLREDSLVFCSVLHLDICFLTKFPLSQLFCMLGCPLSKRKYVTCEICYMKYFKDTFWTVKYEK